MVYDIVIHVPKVKIIQNQRYGSFSTSNKVICLYKTH